MKLADLKPRVVRFGVSMRQFANKQTPEEQRAKKLAWHRMNALRLKEGKHA